MGQTETLLIFASLAVGFALMIGVIVVIVRGANQGRAREQKILDDARNAYQGALAGLKQQPTNPDLKQRALELGRAYSSMTRQQSGVTVYDEMALMNDINAATAAAGAPASSVSAEDRLKRLDSLKASGAITSEEHAAQRKAILEQL